MASFFILGKAGQQLASFREKVQNNTFILLGNLLDNFVHLKDGTE